MWPAEGGAQIAAFGTHHTGHGKVSEAKVALIL